MKIAWFGLLDSDDATLSTRALAHLTRLARQIVAQSGQAWTIDLISCGRDPGYRTIAGGVERIVLPVSGTPQTVWDRVSWALPANVAAADLVHLHDGFSRSCEMALLVAKQLHKPVCMTEWPVEGYWLSGELALRDLADAVICHDMAVANSIATSKPVHLVPCGIDVRDLGVPASWPANHCIETHCGENAEPSHDDYVAAGINLAGIYRSLLDGTRRAAA